MRMHPKRARVSATLRRRGSERKPMPWCSLDLISIETETQAGVLRLASTYTVVVVPVSSSPSQPQLIGNVAII